MGKGNTKREKLAERVSTLEDQIKEIAKVATGCAAFVNALIKHTGITNEKLQLALFEAGVSNAASQFVQSSVTGHTVGDRGLSDGLVSGGTSDRTDSGVTATAGDQANAGSQNGQTSAGDQPVSSGSGEGSNGVGIQGPEANNGEASNGQP